MEQVTVWVADEPDRETEETPRGAVAAIAVLVACVAGIAIPTTISVLALVGWIR